MAEMKKIPVRSEVKKEDTWALEDIYKTVKDWEKDCERAAELAQKAALLEGRIGANAENLYEYCMLDETLGSVLNNVAGYASRLMDQDTSDAAGQQLRAKAMSLYVECASKVSFASPEIMAVEEENLQAFFAQKPELEVYRRSINEERRCREHILSPELEKMLADAGEMAQAPQNIFNMLNNADLSFDAAVDADGQEHEVTHGSYLPLLESSDRILRRSAYESLYDAYRKVLNTTAALLNAQVNKQKFFAKARKYSSTMEAALDGNNVPVSVYKNLIEAVHENIGILHRYMKLRKKLMKVDELHMYDLYTTVVPDVDVRVSYELAKQEVLEATAVLGEEYRRDLAAAFENRWVDVYENKGKRSGAYSAGLDVHPFVLMNYKETLNNEFTLAHEMGHAMHSWLSAKAQRPVDRHYVIFVAEVASTCNEALLMEYLLNKTEDKKTRAYLINHFLEQFRTTVYRQTMFAEFEMLINEASEKGESLTADTLCGIYKKLNEFYYGEDVDVDELIAGEWARIPHFYMNFYVFQYATGFSAAMALSKKIKEEGQTAVEKYLQFLSGGCSKDPISLLKDAGVDMRTAQPVNEALALFDSLLDEMEVLVNEI